MSESNLQPGELQPADAELLELYLDGQLSGERLMEAKKRISQVPAMQRAAMQQERINHSLKKQFQPPAVSEAFLQTLLAGGTQPNESLNEPVAEAVVVAPAKPPSDAQARRQRRMQILAIAASLACVAMWSSFGWDQLKQLWQPNGGYEQLTVAQVYRDAVEQGFKPDWLCEDDQEFAKTFADRQGEGLLLKPLPEGIRMAGLAYLSGFTPQATSMLAYVEEKPVLLMVGRKDLVSEASLAINSEQGISVFTRQLGELMLVEVTPFDKPRLLDFVTTAEVPTAPTGHVPGTPYP